MTRRRKIRLAIFLAVYLAFLAGLVEVAARAYWVARGLSFFGCHREIHFIFYPELKYVEEPARADNGVFDVLMLGASVLHPACGDIAQGIREELASRKIPARVWNLAQGGHTTLDSLYKYRHLEGERFDLVLVYDSINDVRANNIAAADFREDYGHYSWYRRVNAYERGYGRRFLAAPITLRMALINAGENLGVLKTIPQSRPSPAAMDEGAELKTPPVFRRNMGAILDLANSRGDRALLMTFAYYIPPDYTIEKFSWLQLDYVMHWFPIEVWGRPENVARGIDAHNAEIKGLASWRDGVSFLPMAELIPREGIYFNDVCHLTREGCRKYVENVLPAVLEAAKKFEPAPAK